jgi:hypothetical protein
MEAVSINWLSVLVAAISAFMVGGIWYGPLFGKAWMSAFNFTEEELAKRNMGMVFGVAFLLSLIAAINLEMFLGPEASIGFGTAAGFAAGLGWVGTFLGILYLFEHRSLKAWAVNAGYCTVALTVMGVVLGAW